jgi:hypothetical protein
VKLKALVLPLIGVIGGFFAMAVWALASPPGSAPDDDFHLPSIWCARGFVEGVCDPEVAGDGFGKTPAPLSPSAICFAFDSKVSAACQENLFDWSSTELGGSRINDKGRFPNGFYWGMHTFINDNPLNSAMQMRFANIILALVVLLASLIVATSRIRFALMATWLVLIVPLGLFTIASTNPSSWTIIGLGTYWANLLTFLTTKEKRRQIFAGVLSVLTAGLALVSRSESAVFVVIISVVIAFVVFSFVEWKKLILPAVLTLVGFYEFITTPSTLGISTGLQGGLPERTNGMLWFYNVSELTTLWSGAIGGWPLGWFDTPMPSITLFFSILAFAGLLFMGLGKSSFRKTIGLIVIVFSLSYIPLRVLLLGRNFIGEGVQPRYFLPLLMVFFGLALYVPLKQKMLQLGWLQYLVLFAGLSVSHAFALHFTMRRYITGTDVIGYNLNKNAEWWWSFAPAPLTSWAIASIGFSLALLAGLSVMRKSSIN